MNTKDEFLNCLPGRKEVWGEGCDTTRQLKTSQYAIIRQFPVWDTAKVFWKLYLCWFWREGKHFLQSAWEPLRCCIWFWCRITKASKSYKEKDFVNESLSFISLSKTFFLNFYLYALMFSLHMYLYERVRTLELEIQTLVSCHMCAKNLT